MEKDDKVFEESVDAFFGGLGDREKYIIGALLMGLRIDLQELAKKKINSYCNSLADSGGMSAGATRGALLALVDSIFEIEK